MARHVDLALIEAATLGGMWWHTYPHSGPILTVLSFAYGFLFGMGNMAFTRVKGWWPRMLLLTPFLLTVLVSQAMLGAARLADADRLLHSPRRGLWPLRASNARGRGYSWCFWAIS